MHTSSAFSSNSLASRAKRIVQYGRPVLSIELDNVEPGAIGCYTSADRLKGQVSMTTTATTRFDQVHIMLEGTVHTSVEHMSPVAAQTRTEASHTFLRLYMPLADHAYPEMRVAVPGETLVFPFHFVIPSQLLPSACPHDDAANHVREAHLRPPPSMGDPDLAAADDLAPHMARVSYAVKVRVLRLRDQEARIVVLAKTTRKIRVLPRVPEAPPLDVSADDREYSLSATKTLRKGVFRGRLGRLTAIAAQTSSLVVDTTTTSDAFAATTRSRHNDEDNHAGARGGSGGGDKMPTTTATVRLRFDAADATAAPPRLGSLSARIRASTFYSARPLAQLATRTGPYDISRGVYPTSVQLATRCIANVPWTRTAPAPASQSPRHASEDSARNTNGTAPVYEATVLVPLTLPRSKTWLPTFHSCLVSRTYLLDVSLTAHSPGTAVPATTLHLRLPLQLSTASAGAAADIDGALQEDPYAQVDAVFDEGDDSDEAIAAGRGFVPPPDYYIAGGRVAR